MDSAHLQQLRACCRDQAAFEQMQQILAAATLTQAERLAQTCQQSRALTQALDQLQKSQTQLIQMQRVAGLGQLTAGIAEEVDKPVRFTCDSIIHARQYAQQYVELLTRYQQEHTAPSPELQQRLEELNPEFMGEDFLKLLSAMEMSSNRIRQLVLSLQSFSHPDVDEMQLANLHDGIDSALVILHYSFKPKSNSPGINVVCEYGKLSLVECYANQINQVFMNVIGEAVDALKAAAAEPGFEQDSYRPQITIRTRQIPDPQGKNPRAVICIADNALSLSTQFQSPRAEPCLPAQPIGSTSLRLSVSRDIVSSHSGELQCYSQPGVGTEIWIELPSHQIRPAAVKRTGKPIAEQPPKMQSAVF